MNPRFSPVMRQLDWLVRRPIAHRGLHDVSKGVLENTETAFHNAMKGDYAIECDLQMTKDGSLVVFHDETLDRLTEGKGMPREMTTRELKSVTLRGTRDRMQTLPELLEQVDRRVPLVIELKSHWDGNIEIAKRATEITRTYRGPFALMSFDPHIVEAVRLHAPDTVRGIVADRAVDSYYNVLQPAERLELRTMSHYNRTAPDFVSFCFSELPWPPVTAFRNAGLPVISWTIRTPEEAAQARRYSDQVTFEGFVA